MKFADGSFQIGRRGGFDSLDACASHLTSAAMPSVRLPLGSEIPRGSAMGSTNRSHATSTLNP